MKKKVILDTDTGVDDALAIILALRSSELDVQAITTVSGNVHVDQCTRNVLRVLTLLEALNPPLVAKGCERPLVKPPFNVPSVHGEDGLGDLEDDFYGEVSHGPLVSTHAVEIIINFVRKWPYEITLIATGPLTNIATAIRQDPWTMRNLKEIILMGGAINVPGNIPPGAAEFNVFVDPHAAGIVLGFGVPVTMVGLDVTHQVKLTREWVQREFMVLEGKIPRFIIVGTQKYMDFYRDDQGYDGCYLHDPLAVGVAIDPSFVRMDEMRIYVETEGKFTTGMTLPFQHPTRDPAKIDLPNVKVCTRVEADRFLAFFLERVKASR